MYCSRKPNEVRSELAPSVSASGGLSLLTEATSAQPDEHGNRHSRSIRQFDSEEFSMSMRIVRGLIEAAEQVGVSRRDLLRAADFDPAQLDFEDACVPRSALYRLCELTLDLTGDPAFGLHWVERLCGTAFNPVSHLAAHAATLGQGLESLQRFHRLLSDQPSFRVCEGVDKVTVVCSKQSGASLRMHRLASEMLVLGLFRLIRSYSALAQVESVSFDYAMPGYHDEYRRAFEIAPRFEQPFTCLVFDRALMNAASLHKDEDVHDALRVIAERRILRLTQHTPFSSRVRDLLVEQAQAHPPDMNRVARALGLSKRSLRRRLVSEGRAYKVIAKEALAIVAKQHLRSGRLTIKETAYEMGFADTSTFHRAFKRWTGRTPSAYREMPVDQPTWNARQALTNSGRSIANSAGAGRKRN